MADLNILSGDVIIWKLQKRDWIADILSFALCLKDKTWRARKWRGWHMGYVVDVSGGEITTSQAVNVLEGVCAVTYASRDDMGDCCIYHWLDAPIDNYKIAMYAAAYNGEKYDISAYFWTIFTYLFNVHIALYNDKFMCWENVNEFVDFMGCEFQPLNYMPLISTIMNKLEDKQNATNNRP